MGFEITPACPSSLGSLGAHVENQLQSPKAGRGLSFGLLGVEAQSQEWQDRVRSFYKMLIGIDVNCPSFIKDILYMFSVIAHCQF